MLSFWNLECIFSLKTSQATLIRFQVSYSHVLFVATLLDRADLKYVFSTVEGPGPGNSSHCPLYNSVFPHLTSLKSKLAKYLWEKQRGTWELWSLIFIMSGAVCVQICMCTYVPTETRRERALEFQKLGRGGCEPSTWMLNLSTGKAAKCS